MSDTIEGITVDKITKGLISAIEPLGLDYAQNKAFVCFLNSTFKTSLNMFIAQELKSKDKEIGRLKEDLDWYKNMPKEWEKDAISSVIKYEKLKMKHTSLKKRIESLEKDGRTFVNLAISMLERKGYDTVHFDEYKKLLNR